MIEQAVAAGMAAIVIDPKGDAVLRSAAAGAAIASGRRFQLWSPDGDCSYNPYSWGTADEIADRVLAGERFTEPHYMRGAQRYVGHVVRAQRAAGRPLSLRAISALLDPDRLEQLAAELPPAGAEPLLAYLSGLSPRGRSDLAGVRDRIAILDESEAGARLDPASCPGATIELDGALRSGAIVYFDLRSDGRPLLAEMIGAAIVGDLQSTVSAMQSRPRAALVAIDEFSALGAVRVAALFARARGAGLSLLLGTQELADLRLSGAERVLDQVLGNLSLLVAHRQALPASASLLSELAGAEPRWRTPQRGRRAPARVVSEPLLDGQRLSRLAVGEAAVFPLASGASARVITVRRPRAAV